MLLDEGTQVGVIQVGLIAEFHLDPKYFIVVSSDTRQSLNSEIVIQLKEGI